MKDERASSSLGHQTYRDGTSHREDLADLAWSGTPRWHACPLIPSLSIEEMTVTHINEITVRQVQDRIRALYGSKDEARGVNGTFMWFMEEVGKLATALRGGESPEAVAAEFADVQAWLATLANIAGVDLGKAVTEKYGLVCPGCRTEPCTCPPHEKP